jgi:hypothetical protein
MIYTLHHSRGHLLISADAREQVVRWSERQLGSRARLVSVTEGNCMDAAPSVERDGTGITAREAEGCRPVVSIMSDHAQDVPGEHGSSGCHDEEAVLAPWRIREPTWH